MIVLKGLIASRGITCNKVFLFVRKKLKFKRRKLESELDYEDELKRLHKAVRKSRDELKEIKEDFLKKGEKSLAHIFRSQLTITEDDEFISEVERKIKEENINAEWALELIVKEYENLFNELKDSDYNKERLNDLKDVENRILENLLPEINTSLKRIPGKRIVIANELFPSDTANMDTKNVSGIITEKGGITSHVSIIAKSLDIPAVVGVNGITDAVKNDDTVCIDALGIEEASVYINPDYDLLKETKRKSLSYRTYLKNLQKIMELDPVTTDGKKLIVSANIGSMDDFIKVKEKKIKSVGLFRTEFLFLNTLNFPNEDQQFEIYKKVAEGIKPGMVIIRTMDIGGDKSIPSIKLPQEQNPFLGLRAIRVGLKYPEILKQQISAILRAAEYGNVKIMFPMISDVTEVRKIKKLISDVKNKLIKNNVKINSNIEIGIMVEIPSAAIMADVLSKEVDFFSIGTNDLTQYLLAADRMNENVSDYYRPFHPSVFRMIKKVVDALDNSNKWVGVCGELGGMINAVPILVGLGVKELSMEPSLIPVTIDIIRNISFSESEIIANDVLEMETEHEIKSYMRDKLKVIGKNCFLLSQYESMT